MNIGQFTKDFNERTKADMGMMIPVVITVYSDRSFTFITKTPPAALLIKKACGIDKASGVPQRDKVATISKEDLRKIAEQKMPDLNCTTVESAMSMIAGTCRSMGVVVGGRLSCKLPQTWEESPARLNISDEPHFRRKSNCSEVRIIKRALKAHR